ncbi:hypothetical protein [Halobacillus salinus]|nr:hypothetical protein [Halobacillus salinus]
MKRKAKPNSSMKPVSAGTDPQKVRKEIQEDISHGVGSMTSRQAGATRD